MRLACTPYRRPLWCRRPPARVSRSETPLFSANGANYDSPARSGAKGWVKRRNDPKSNKGAS